MTPSKHYRQAAHISLRSPWHDWRFIAAGVAAFLGVIALGAYLDQGNELPPEDPQVIYNRGVMAGRQQMLQAYAERNRVAFQAGMDEGFQRCSGKGGRK